MCVRDCGLCVRGCCLCARAVECMPAACPCRKARLPERFTLPHPLSLLLSLLSLPACQPAGSGSAWTCLWRF